MIKVHIGCGKRDWPDWINIDGANFDHIHYHDITALPFEDNSVDLIYSSHLIAYFNRQEIVPLLIEWKRVLKPDGILRLATPDFEAVVKVYLEGAPVEDLLGLLYGQMQMGKDTIYHRTVYDESSLSVLLENLGFWDIDFFNYNKTEHDQFDDHSKAHYPNDPKAIEKGEFTDDHTLMSLNIQCRK